MVDLQVNKCIYIGKNRTCSIDFTEDTSVFSGVARQIGTIQITGTIDNICFYKMDGKYYARMRSSIDAKRVKTDTAFKRTMEEACLLGKASKLASILYQSLPSQNKGKFAWYKLLAEVRLMLHSRDIGVAIIQLPDTANYIRDGRSKKAVKRIKPRMPINLFGFITRDNEKRMMPVRSRLRKRRSYNQAMEDG